MKNKGFTIIELAIVILTIGLISAILIPQLIEAFQSSKENIIDAYNGQERVYIDYDTNTIIDDIEDYELIDVQIADGRVYMYFKYKGE